ncbi:MAG: hypothetical protein ACRCYS_09185, partial [Beijerinckiaceae bacterium]
SEDVRNFTPPSSMAHVDWLTMASLRDSENVFFDYDESSDALAGITMPGELAKWFRRAGYQSVKEETNLVMNKSAKAIDAANKLYAQGYRVCLFINAQMLSAGAQDKFSFVPNHWVVLTSPITMSGGKIQMTVFSWGDGEHAIPNDPAKPLAVDDFIDNFYGYVAAKG